MENETYRIEEGALAYLKTQVLRLQRTAQRLGSGEIAIHDHGTEVARSENGSAKVYHLISIVGDRPAYNGWQFVATISRVDGEVLISTVPGVVQDGELVAYRDRPEMCDHCHQNRLRNDTYIVRHTDGTTKQVGSRCIKDFLGHDDPGHLLRLAALWGELGGLCSAAERDFMQFDPAAPFDRVIMNPPFEDGQDMAHVQRAWGMLAPGGILVAVMGVAWQVRQGAKWEAFRGWLAAMGAEVENLPAGLFLASDRPTGVPTVLVVLEKE